MIDFTDLTAVEVRALYVLPLLHEMLEKSGISSSKYDTMAGIGSMLANAKDTAGTGMPTESPETNIGAGGAASTFFQEIASHHTFNESLSDLASVPWDARSYTVLLEEAAAVSAYMTQEEHIVITAIATTCFLSYLIPQCNSLAFLQNYFQKSPSSAHSVLLQQKSNTPPVSTLSDLSNLEDRLEWSILSNNSNTSGGIFPYSAPRMKSLEIISSAGFLVGGSDGLTTSPFHRFVMQGLGSFLSSGKAFNSSFQGEVSSDGGDGDGDNTFPSSGALIFAGADFIQILAMAICPDYPNSTSFPLKEDNISTEKQGKNAFDKVTSSIANSTLPFSFQLSYLDRLQLVRLCAEKLVIPERENSHVVDTGIKDGPVESKGNELFSGNDVQASVSFNAALLQLRTSLVGFSLFHAISEADQEVAYKALANVTINEGNSSTVHSEFERLLSILLEMKTQSMVLAVGKVLEKFISHYNGSRFYADGTFTQFALGLLGTCIQVILTNNIKTNNNERRGSVQQKNSDTESGSKRQKTDKVCKGYSASERLRPYHLEALFKVARPLFYFLLECDAKKENGVTDPASIQLIRNATSSLEFLSTITVIQSASNMIALFLAYDGKYLAEDNNVKHLFDFTKCVLRSRAIEDLNKELDLVEALKQLIITASKKSATFAFNLLSYVSISCEKSPPPSKKVVWKTVSMITRAQPLVTFSHLQNLVRATELEVVQEEETIFYQIIACLSSSSSYTCYNLSEPIERCNLLAERVTNSWTLFQLVRHSFVSSKFGFAHQILDRLLPGCRTQQSFLWLRSLSLMAQAEEIITTKGVSGISETLEKLNLCYSTVLSLAPLAQKNTLISRDIPNRTENNGSGNFEFQMEFLKARLDFLQLCMVTHSLCAEIMMVDGNVSRETRSELYRKNLPRCYASLATHVMILYKLYGLHYCQQTRSALRTLFAMCQLMGDFVRYVFFDSMNSRSSVKHQEFGQFYPKGDINHPMGSILRRLREEVLETLEKSRDLSLLKLVSELANATDAILHCPIEFPAGYHRVKPIHKPFCANLSVDTQNLEQNQRDKTIGNSKDFGYVSADPVCAEILEVRMGIPLKMIVSGQIPKQFIESARVEFFQIIVWRSVNFEGQLMDDEDADDSNTSSNNDDLPSQEFASDPFSTNLLPDGKFFLNFDCEPLSKRGYYRVKVVLGCRDIRCGEWLIPTLKPIPELFLFVDEEI